MCPPQDGSVCLNILSSEVEHLEAGGWNNTVTKGAAVETGRSLPTLPGPGSSGEAFVSVSELGAEEKAVFPPSW